MKPHSIIAALLIAGIVFSGCVHTGHSTGKPLPPGQAKKVFGGKSAKPYAPGQQKKKH
ncbi:quinol oxidase subunit 4 [uncultured Chitinophaga sp.]|uniref:quinol oxidase subunit 4 n=1 Tax=uncultured Chitinophaga sp. TaxID=339340 RepID=UPI0025CDD4C8|nr:quinol oxidase subunit 4 [uncultured Chitinophaga sp.]